MGRTTSGASSSMAFAVALLAGAPALAAGPVIRVPRASPAVIDGRIDEAEWTGSAVERLPNGTVLRLRHDGSHLFLGIESPSQAFASVCAELADSVRVLHASAALGSVTYERSARDWETKETEFDYGMRNVELSEEARAERREYLSRHGWVASTFRMGGGLVQELQLSLDRFRGMRCIALASFVAAGDTAEIATWPEFLAPGDGCADAQLVRGEVPPSLRFDPRGWASLELAGN